MDMKDDSFKFEDIPFIEYPIYIKSKDDKSFYNFKSSVSGNGLKSRTKQLNNRSLQSKYMDLLISIRYFKLLGINYEIYKEVPIINTNLTNDPDRSYYLLDYFIPDLSLAIELDSSYHDQNPIKDKLKDQFLSSIGIDVVRIRDFNIDTNSKLDNLASNILSRKVNKFRVSYESLIYESSILRDKFHLERIKLLNGPLYFIKSKWRDTISKLGEIDNNIIDSILNNKSYSFIIDLDDIHKILPFNDRKVTRYNSLINYLKTFNISMTIRTIRNKNKLSIS